MAPPLDSRTDYTGYLPEKSFKEPEIQKCRMKGCKLQSCFLCIECKVLLWIKEKTVLVSKTYLFCKIKC